ncbi:MAG: hypothetical protein ABIL70_09150 [candidate division WOR-3 bacterium]
MEKNRRNHTLKESGIALVTVLVIVAIVLMLTSSITYLLLKGLSANVINKQFATVYEAANGGVEYLAGIINAYINGQDPQNIGGVSGDLSGIINNCSPGIATITMKTSDGNYTIKTSIQCLGTSPVPGQGGVLRFPPPPPLSAGGIGSTKNAYIFYSIISIAQKNDDPKSIARTEAVYKTVK